ELSIEQPLFTGGRITYQTRAAARRADAAEQLAQQERVDVAFEIRSAFWNLYGALALEEATDAAVAYMDELVEDVENRFEVGAALMSDVLSARARRSEVLLERVEARNLVRTGRLELAQLIGLPLDSEIDPAPVAPLDPPPAASTEPMVPSTPRIRALMDEVVSIQAQID